MRAEVNRKSVRSAAPWSTLTVVGTVLALAVLGAACSSSTANTPAAQANALVQAGLRAQAHGRNAEALQDYREAVAKDPTNKFAYYNAGVIFQERNDVPDASAAYRKALLADETYKPALFNLAILLTPSQPAEAITLYNELLQINANDPNVLYNLGLLLIAQNQAAQGHAYLQKAIQLQPALKNKLPAGITP